MPTLSEAFVDSLAPNAAAVKNGWGLVKKNQFITLYKSEDGSVLFGECKGSGKNNYLTSVDFFNETPVARCTCPSRQFPCKHSLGLMYCFVQGADFSIAPIPEEIVEKREKSAQRLEKKKEQKSIPKKVNKTALAKKITAQIEGLSVLERQIHHLLRSGLATIDAKKLKDLEDIAKQLGNYYLKEVQHDLREMILLWHEDLPEDPLYSLAFEQIQQLYVLCKKGKQHLTKRLEDQELLPEVETDIEERLGHIWQLADLRDRHLSIPNVKLVQLSFYSTKSGARKEFIEEGIWLDLNKGSLYYTKNFRPFRAVKQIKEGNSIFSIVSMNELFVYPGEGTPRIRFEEYQFEKIEDLKHIKTLAKQNVEEVVKKVRNQLRQSLADKQPIEFLAFSKLGKVNGKWMLEGMDGSRLTLSDEFGKNPTTMPLLDLLSNKDLENNAMLVRFHHDLENGILAAKPLTIVTSNRMIRLLG
ncbi:SWIM zinc finger family protein [Neobacillus massiliamazoniensis]|uniref:SWIM-type domain-containing protein n=1 Tax=Neobacillus massiliamazoniensis TaxID=1499688 RepID=A0A0U1NQ91_9BACI|nr:SWIM zinc finger family protein [Neobacillus massiliamazoniensis]CRK80213.1 hypothetical protein BN000_00094 [Neobacillus massiliamazoniensis]